MEIDKSKVFNMKTSESIKSVAAALCKAQTNIESASKNANNPHFRSKYADINAVIDACKAALNNEGISVVQSNGKDELGSYVETMLLHNTGEFLSSKVYLILDKMDMQKLGSAITYARRYGIQSMVFMGSSEDDDANSVAIKNQLTVKNKSIIKNNPNTPDNKSDVDAIFDLIKKKISEGTDRGVLLKFLEIKEPNDLKKWDSKSLLDAYKLIKEKF